MLKLDTMNCMPNEIWALSGNVGNINETTRGVNAATIWFLMAIADEEQSEGNKTTFVGLSNVRLILAHMWPGA